MATAFLFVYLSLLAVWVGLLCHYSNEKKLIGDFAFGVIGRREKSIEVVLAMAGEIFRTRKVWNSNQAFLPLSFFSALGATPASILRTGGCCSDLTRLTIVSLNALGFKACSITVCPLSGKARHCLVEVSLEGHNILVDPTYGIYYVDGQRRGIDLADLRSGMRPLFASLPHSTKMSYPAGSYYEFDYGQSKTANWTDNRVRKAMYRVLFFMTKGAIDRVKQPAVLEWPQLVLATSIFVLLLSMNLAVMLF